MALKYMILLNLLIITVKSSKTPEVREEINEDASYLPENVRVARHPKFQYLHEPPNFDFKTITQQDPQRIRYVQQQQVDSYMRAYHQELASKIPQKHRKNERNLSGVRTDQLAKTTYDARPKSENRQPQQKHINFNRFPAEAMTDQHPKKVDPVQLRKVPVIDNSPEESINDQKNSKTSREKAPLKQKLGYQVREASDQDTEPSSEHESRVYFGQDEILKTIQNYPTPLNPNYLAKPTYILANPQLNQISLDPKLLNDAANYALPANHQLSYAGFESASKADLEALSSLIGKAPNAQLQGLNELLDQQSGYAVSAPSIPIPETPKIILQDDVASIPQAQQQVVLQNVDIHPQALAGVKDFTPIREEVIDVANTQVKPNIQTAISETQFNINTHASSNQELKLAREPKSIYEDHDDNLQYAAQYAFGYKIRDYHSGNNFGHEEVREGDVAKGHYHVLLPDGRLQNVEYWADPSGYHATVTYTNVAQH